VLIPLTDAEGRETWINPIHVKVVRTRKGMLGGGKGTEVWFSFTSNSEAIYFSESPAEIAAALNGGMPPVVALDTSGDEPPMQSPQTGG
jgi:hypothetical protein